MYLIKPHETFLKVDPEAFFYNNGHYGSREVLLYDFPETSLIDWVRENFTDSSKDFVDIGANVGSWTMKLAPHFHHTHSFECNKDTYNCLCANIFLKRLSSKVSAHSDGLSSKPETLTFYLRGNDGGNDGVEPMGESLDSGSKDVVKVDTLDSKKLDNVGFIKIDVEGHELDVLKGSIQTLSNNNYPPFIFESWRPDRDEEGRPASKLRKELFAYVEEIGYTVVPIRGFDEIFLAQKK